MFWKRIVLFACMSSAFQKQTHVFATEPSGSPEPDTKSRGVDVGVVVGAVVGVLLAVVTVVVVIVALLRYRRRRRHEEVKTTTQQPAPLPTVTRPKVYTKPVWNKPSVSKAASNHSYADIDFASVTADTSGHADVDESIYDVINENDYAGMERTPSYANVERDRNDYLTPTFVRGDSVQSEGSGAYVAMDGNPPAQSGVLSNPYASVKGDKSGGHASVKGILSNFYASIKSDNFERGDSVKSEGSGAYVVMDLNPPAQSGVLSNPYASVKGDKSGGHASVKGVLSNSYASIKGDKSGGDANVNSNGEVVCTSMGPT